MSNEFPGGKNLTARAYTIEERNGYVHVLVQDVTVYTNVPIRTVYEENVTAQAAYELARRLKEEADKGDLGAKPRISMNFVVKFVAEIRADKIYKRSDFLKGEEVQAFLERFFPEPEMLLTMDFYTVLTLESKGILIDRNKRWEPMEGQSSSELSSNPSDSPSQPRPERDS